MDWAPGETCGWLGMGTWRVGFWDRAAGKLWRRSDEVECEDRSASGCWRRPKHCTAEVWGEHLGEDTLEQVGGWLEVLYGDRGKGRDGAWDREKTGQPEGVGFWDRFAGGVWQRPEHRSPELWRRLWWWRLAVNDTREQVEGWLRVRC